MKAQRNIEIKNPDNPMTNKQSYKLMMVTGVTLYYMEEYPYTIQEASDLIDSAMNGKAYHVRVELAQHEGAKVSWKDVGKDYRSDPKPRGYKAAMEMLDEPEEVEEEEAEEDELAILKARIAELEANKTPAKPKPEPQGSTKAQKRAALQRQAERNLKKHTKQNPEPPPAKKDKSSDDNGQAKKDAVIAMLAEQSGLDIDRIKQLQKAFNAIA